MKDKIFIDKIEFSPKLEVDMMNIVNMFDSSHEQDCCENHKLDFDNFANDFKMVEDLLKEIDKIEIYWEVWMGITIFLYDWEKRVWIFIPWRWINNWYYWTDLTLIVILPNWFTKEYDIEEYQDITE